MTIEDSWGGINILLDIKFNLYILKNIETEIMCYKIIEIFHYK